MIHYNSLWETMSNKHFTTYTLREKHNIGHGTVQRLQKNMPVSTYTLDRLCKILDCRLNVRAAGQVISEKYSLPHTTPPEKGVPGEEPPPPGVLSPISSQEMGPRPGRPRFPLYGIIFLLTK